MKNANPLVILFLSLLLITMSCKKNDLLVPAQKEEALSEKLQKFLRNNQLNSKNVKEDGNYYIVEGDIVIDKEELRKQPTTTPRQAHTNSIVQGNLTNITIGMESYDLRWFNALRRAVAAWNTVSNCRINLIHSYNNLINAGEPLNADIVVRTASLGTGYFGRAWYPTGNDKAGHTIEVDPYTTNVYQSGPNRGQSNGVPRTADQDTYTLIHEIGHTLGVKHTDMPYADGIGTNIIPGTPASNDPTSVMNSGNLGTDYGWPTWPSDQRFSAYDKIAATYLYPLGTGYNFKTIINGPASGNAGSTLIMTSGAGADNYQHEWRELDANQNILYGPYEAGQQIEYSMSTPGTYFLETRIINAELTGEWVRKTVTFY